MDIDYRTYQQIRIYLNKINKAIITLQKMGHQLISDDLNHHFQIRISTFKEIEIKLIAILINYETELPYMPKSRCTAAVIWYSKKSIHHIISMASFVEILKDGDAKFINDTKFIIDKWNTPHLIKSVLSQIKYEHFREVTKPHM